MGIDEAIQIVQKEVEILKSRQVIAPEVIQAIHRMKSTMYGFGFYDPATLQDRELARMLRPDFEILTKALNI